MMAAPARLLTLRVRDADIAELARRLEAMRQHAVDEIRDADTVVPTAVEVHDRADEAEGERVDELRMAEAAIDEALLRDIALAEHRIRTGDYGLCLDCGEAIPRARLLAQPTAVRCAACQSAVESGPAT
jgi:DnaK suppressor protein